MNVFTSLERFEKMGIHHLEFFMALLKQWLDANEMTRFFFCILAFFDIQITINILELKNVKHRTIKPNQFLRKWNIFIAKITVTGKNQTYHRQTYPTLPKYYQVDKNKSYSSQYIDYFRHCFCLYKSFGFNIRSPKKNLQPKHSHIHRSFIIVFFFYSHQNITILTHRDDWKYLCKRCDMVLKTFVGLLYRLFPIIRNIFIDEFAFFYFTITTFRGKNERTGKRAHVSTRSTFFFLIHSFLHHILLQSLSFIFFFLLLVVQKSFTSVKPHRSLFNGNIRRKGTVTTTHKRYIYIKYHIKQGQTGYFLFIFGCITSKT